MTKAGSYGCNLTPHEADETTSLITGSHLDQMYFKYFTSIVSDIKKKILLLFPLQETIEMVPVADYVTRFDIFNTTFELYTYR